MSAAAAFGFVQIIHGVMGARNQLEIDKAAVELEFESDLEEIRRREFTQDQVKGLTSALSQASGITHKSGSTGQTYLDAMTAEFKKEIDFADAYAARARRIGLAQARSRYSSGVMSAVAGGAKAFI